MSTTEQSGRVAVITGASSGIGEATARALAADGYRVALLARRAERIGALAAELGDGAIAVPADVTDRDELGPAGVLVNNAGIMLLAPFGPDQREDYRRMIEVNLLGAITATEVFLDQLRAGGEGDIVNISSVATELTDHITHEQTRETTERFVEELGMQPQDIAQVIAFAVSRPRRMAINEILVRPAGQA